MIFSHLHTAAYVAFTRLTRYVSIFYTAPACHVWSSSSSLFLISVFFAQFYLLPISAELSRETNCVVIQLICGDASVMGVESAVRCLLGYFLIGKICRVRWIVDGLLWFIVAVLMTVLASVILRSLEPMAVQVTEASDSSCPVPTRQPLTEYSRTSPCRPTLFCWSSMKSVTFSHSYRHCLHRYFVSKFIWQISAASPALLSQVLAYWSSREFSQSIQ